MSDVFKTVIVDDEPNSREILAHLLSYHNDVELIAKCKDIREGEQSIVENTPDVVFLDIEMPGGDGFELLDKLRRTELDPTIIFITAYNQFAIKAIKYAAFDYLVKPIDIDDLSETLKRLRSNNGKLKMKAKVDVLLEQFPQFEKLKFNTRSGMIFISPDELVWCEASGSYSILHFHSRKQEMVSIPIKSIEAQLKGKSFFRISRSAIINLRYLVRIDRKARKCVVQKDQKVYEISASNSNLKALECI
ncbi:MAG TPA: response regulator transcription factor [Tenuifilaceae bacterium]|nr:response regulator transcription factor [Tenuifilaceae bacterium]HRX31373.1 response regulator transcription factor [Tenuifilaceae bacterium]